MIGDNDGLTEAQKSDIIGNGRSLSASEAGEYVRLKLMRISFEQGGCGARLAHKDKKQ